MEEKSSYPFCGDRFLSGAENYPLCKAMVDHDQQRIEARGKGKVGDQVAGDLLEGARSVGLNWDEWGDGGVCIQFVLLACGAAFNVPAHELCKAWPPELGSDELAGFEISWVTGGFMIVAAGEDGTTEGVLWGDIDATFVGQHVVIELPV